MSLFSLSSIFGKTEKVVEQGETPIHAFSTVLMFQTNFILSLDDTNKAIETLRILRDYASTIKSNNLEVNKFIVDTLHYVETMTFILQGMERPRKGDTLLEYYNRHWYNPNYLLKSTIVDKELAKQDIAAALRYLAVRKDRIASMLIEDSAITKVLIKRLINDANELASTVNPRVGGAEVLLDIKI